MKIVLDTKVLISGLLNPSGVPAQIVSLMLNGKIKLVYDNRILSEYSDVLFPEKFKFKPEWIEPLLEFIKVEGEFVLADPMNMIFDDEDDLIFYEVTKTAKANYLITGNLTHFPEDKLIVSPKAFIDIFFKNEEKRD